MITVNTFNTKYNNIADFEFLGLSTDQKPAKFDGYSVGRNSVFLELDTMDLFYFDGSTWQPLGGE